MATYTIIGHDGKKYSSVSEEQLRQWTADGRVNAQTKAQIEGSAEWKPLSEFPEFASALISFTPPPLPVAAPAKKSVMAVLSLVLGILGAFTCGITALIGLILGIIAMVKVKNSGGKLSGNGLALAGVIVSAIFLFMIPIFAAMLLPALAQAKQKAQEINCLNNEKQLALAIRIYSGDNTNHFPPAATWCDAIKPEAGSEKIFKCPAANSSSRCDYAFNAKLDGIDASSISRPSETVLIFESDAGWDASGGAELFPVRPRHGFGQRAAYVVAFADGHVEAVTPARLNSLRWNP